MDENKRILISKLVLCGAYKVGKTSLRRRYMGENFFTDHLATLGADFAVKKIEVNPNFIFELQIWDLGGQISFKKLRQRFFEGSSAAFILFDVTKRSTFEELDQWLEELWKKQDKTKIPLMFIGNKIDLEDKEVTEDDVIKYIEEVRNKHNLHDLFIGYIFTSAKTGENINEAFETISQVIIENHKIEM